MRRGVAKLRGLAYLMWHLKHEMTHVLLGLVWAWFLREWWSEFNVRWVATSIVGSLLPDVEHFIFFFGYGKRDPYTQQIFAFLRTKQWRNLAYFMSKGHKHMHLPLHNLYFMLFLFTLALLSLFVDWNAGVVLFGAMLIHYFFDIIDDIFVLGYVNANWKRLGKRSRRFHAS